MRILKWKKSFNLLQLPKKCLSTSIDSEYTSTPQYPPILDLSFSKKKEREKSQKHEEIRNVKTVEEKQIKLNMPKYYGFKTQVFYEDKIPYNNLELAQHVTRTHLIETNDFPKYYENIGVNSSVLETLKNDLMESLILEVEGYRKTHDLKTHDLLPNEIDNIIGSSIVKQLNRVIINNLSRTYNHLVDIQVNYDPRIESCWTCGGMLPPERIKSYRRNLEWMKSMENDPIDRTLTYVGNPYLTLRTKQPLPFIISEKDAENPSFDVPFFKYDPVVVGVLPEYRRIVNTPGFWPGDKYNFGFLQYLKRGHHINRRFNDADDDKKALHRQGILSSFGWLNAQANFLGFTTYNEITYPIVAQTIITNGKVFSLYLYQLNTMLLHSNHTTENPKKNICWATPELNLYEKVENGKLEGFNDELLSKLMKFYANAPSERLGVNLTPYLGQHENIIADYEDAEKKEWLEREYKMLTSNRPRFKLLDEVYAWEKIYKIDHKTRFMDKKLRPFELRINPTNRKLDERKPFYIPRKLRPHLKKNVGRDAKEYFP